MKAQGDGRQGEGSLMHDYTQAVKQRQGLQGQRPPISQRGKPSEEGEGS